MLAYRQVENDTLLENPKKYYEQMVVSSVIFRIFSLIFFFFLFSVIFPSYNLYARVTGPCSNCHTMHNSQGGSPMALVGESLTEDAVPAMLVNDCVGCHTGTNDGTNTTPYVNSPLPLNESDFGKNGNTLAGGNFWWVADAGGNDDAKGHNVLGIAGVDIAITGTGLNTAPGQTNGLGCLCHHTLAKQDTEFGLDGCQGCHFAPKHHANDGTGTKLVNSAKQGWYRFLSGHNTTKGVEGIEHEKWNYKADKDFHNEYLGNVYAGGSGFSLGNTTTAFCTGCHGEFHSEQKSGENWIRHPSDAVICDPDKPDSENSEYAVAFGGVYDPDVPVARISLGSVSSTVTPNSDMVMCLSCHVAHGSPYPDMLRWDYDYMIAGGGGTGGCFKCHTDKN